MVLLLIWVAGYYYSRWAWPRTDRQFARGSVATLLWFIVLGSLTHLVAYVAPLSAAYIADPSLLDMAIVTRTSLVTSVVVFFVILAVYCIIYAAFVVPAARANREYAEKSEGALLNGGGASYATVGARAETDVRER